jgi:6,7-dimethyl-8-ribityllumazine synthase
MAYDFNEISINDPMATKLKNLSDFSGTGVPSAAPYHFGIVVSEWNTEITNALYAGAYESLIDHGALIENIFSYSVPGSFELTAGADLLLKNRKLDAVICLGCVIQGETRHFDFICQAVADGICNVAIKYSKPVIFGVLTTDNQQQALDRSGGKHGNKGVEAAVTAIKMAYLAATLNS